MGLNVALPLHLLRRANDHVIYCNGRLDLHRGPIGYCYYLRLLDRLESKKRKKGGGREGDAFVFPKAWSRPGDVLFLP